MAVQLNINARGVVGFAHKLEQLHRSALPVAVRQTLTSAAFDVKQNTMPASAKGTFVQRKPNFFKATSKVFAAKGFDINNMQAVAGFVGKDQAVEDLDQQETGGRIKGRTFIPLDTARVGNSNQRNVRPNARLKGAKIISSQGGARSRKQNFVRAAIRAYANNALVIGNFDKPTLMRVDDITPIGIGRNALKIKTTPLYSMEKGRTVKVDRTGFMARAAGTTAPKIVGLFQKNALAQIKKYT